MKMFSFNSLPKVIVFYDTDVEPKLTTLSPDSNWFANTFDIISTSIFDEFIKLVKINAFAVDFIIDFAMTDEDCENHYKFYSTLPTWLRNKYHIQRTTEDVGTTSWLNTIKQQISNVSSPLFSVIVPVYNTKEQYLKECVESVINQTDDDWELVLIDDSPAPHEYAMKLAMSDIRIKYYRIAPSRGNIGLSKWRGFSMTTGQYLIELDHDDVLLPWCMELLSQAIEKYPHCGFYYSDNADMDENSNLLEYLYGNNFGNGFGFYYNAKALFENPFGDVINTGTNPNINASTIRHIVGVPNHVRCWKRDVYFSVGGHNQHMRIADDYELLVKTFLHTQFCHIEYPLYVQRFDGTNSQDAEGGINRKDIQRRVWNISCIYNKQIHERLLELCGTDPYYDEQNPEASFKNNGREDIPFVNVVYDVIL